MGEEPLDLFERLRRPSSGPEHCFVEVGQKIRIRAESKDFLISFIDRDQREARLVAFGQEDNLALGRIPKGTF
jgi:hypothetical protein